MKNEDDLKRAREENGWGFVREDLEDNHVQLMVSVELQWDETTPPELKKAFGEANAVMKQIGSKAIYDQLIADGLVPSRKRTLTYGDVEADGEPVIMGDTGWKLFKAMD